MVSAINKVSVLVNIQHTKTGDSSDVNTFYVDISYPTNIINFQYFIV